MQWNQCVAPLRIKSFPMLPRVQHEPCGLRDLDGTKSKIQSVAEGHNCRPSSRVAVVVHCRRSKSLFVIITIHHHCSHHWCPTYIHTISSIWPLPSINVHPSSFILVDMPYIAINTQYSSNHMYYVHMYPYHISSNHMYVFFKIIYRFYFELIRTSKYGHINTYIYIFHINTYIYIIFVLIHIFT
jgi:hypothetical protein